MYFASFCSVHLWRIVKMHYIHFIRYLLICVCYCAIISCTALCPNTADIDPCTCIENGNEITIDCSLAQSQQEIGMAFIEEFPTNELYKFVISDNLILDSLSSNMFGGKSFEQISIRHTNIESIDLPFFLSCIHTVRELEITYNPFLSTFAFDALELFTSLTTLDLGYNDLTMLPQMSSETIEYMYLRHNYISNISNTGFSGFPNLKEVDLEYNFLRELQEGMIYIEY